MKKFKIISIIFFLLFTNIVLVNAEVKDVPLKRSDDPNAVTSARSKKNLIHQRFKTNNPFKSDVFNPFEAYVIDDIFYLEVVIPVGTVQIVVKNETGNVEYAGIYDSSSLSEFALETENWPNGLYNITLTYGLFNFVGDFNID